MMELINTSDQKEQLVIDLLKDQSLLSSKEIHVQLENTFSYATLKRILSNLIDKGLIQSIGERKATKYSISPAYQLLSTITIDDYFKQEIDERIIKTQFDLNLIPDLLSKTNVFSSEEIIHLENLQLKHKENIAHLSAAEQTNELERLAIDLSWKSSQIEGNTYSLLETEILLKENRAAKGRDKDETQMLLNHKYALDFIFETRDYINPLSISKIEDIHSLLVKDLGVNRNIRRRKVGISGTNYTPLDNEHQIREALVEMCNLINSKDFAYEKAMLLLLLISYIQPFADGNKRTARIISNAVLLNAGYCPLSFRTVDPIDYKKAMLIFYEQNNISAFKQIFIQQVAFAVNTYF